MADFDVSVPLHQDPANDPIVAGSINDHANEPLVKKKNKKKKKPAKKTGTGFEEFYADAPLTPGEYLYEKDVLYNKSRPFEMRIEECIHNYRQKRRMDNEKTLIFTKYLQLGGIDPGARQFTSDNLDVDKSGDIKCGNANTEIIKQTDTFEFIGRTNNLYYQPGTDIWEVDWVGVISAFLSIELFELCEWNILKFETGINVVENFLNYVLHHEVCPEYTEQVEECRRICKRARNEMPELLEVHSILPGRFNMLAISICQNIIELKPTDTWAVRVNKNDHDKPEDIENSIDLFTLTALTWAGDALAYLMPKYDARMAITKTSILRLEIFSIKQAQAKLDFTEPDYNTALPIGELVVRDTYIEDSWSNTPTEEDFRAECEILGPKTYSLWVDDNILVKLCIGQKIQAQVHETDTGMLLLGKVFNVYPTFYTFLPQSLMMRFKTPAGKEKPAPTIKTAVDYLDDGYHGDTEMGYGGEDGVTYEA